MHPEELSPDELTALLSSYMPDIPGYRVLRRIGQGGMAHVYLGVQQSLDRQVAIKVMRPAALADENSKQRFEHEARTIAKLEHPCIVGIHEVGRTPQGLLYYVLPYLARGHLGQRDLTQNEPRIVEVLRALLSALDYAHARGVVHRDVKAENVLFDNADRPLLADFGIALSKRADARITSAGLALGSGGYMAPEQARGEAVDGRADLYSVGVLAYELLCGTLPYQSNDPLALALIHAQNPIPRLAPERRHWQAFLDRAMAKAPDNRFQSAAQMLAALNQIPIAGRRAADPIPGESRPVWGKRALLGLVAASAVAIGILALRPASEPPEPSKKTDFLASENANASKSVRSPDLSTSASTSAPPSNPQARRLSPETPALPVLSTAAASAFGQVQTTVTVTALDYDPTLPGARELSAARRQIEQQRLSTPPGDNAIDSLLSAHRLAPTHADIPILSDRTLNGLSAVLTDAIERNRDSAAKTVYGRAKNFAKTVGRLNGKAWQTLRTELPPVLIVRLEQATREKDTAAIARTQRLAGALDVAANLLEPAWSLANAEIRPSIPAKESGPITIMVSTASGSSPPFAVMREEVGRANYARFATATKRMQSACRNRTAPISMKKRSWSNPGFAQTGTHPVVCVNHQDAQAYAAWLSERTGQTYRLPTTAEWRLIANFPGSGDPCRDGRIDCGGTGTVASDQEPKNPIGLAGVRGNVREWLSECAGSCKRRQVAGPSWRDPPGRADPLRTSGLDAADGFDDVGFRLVREMDANR